MAGAVFQGKMIGKPLGGLCLVALDLLWVTCKVLKFTNNCFITQTLRYTLG